MKKAVTGILSLVLFISLSAQPLSEKKHFTRQDTLRGSIGPGRSWWNVLRYDIEVTPDYASRSIKGINTISFQRLQQFDVDPGSLYRHGEPGGSRGDLDVFPGS